MSPQPENPQLGISPHHSSDSHSEASEYSSEERAVLLRLAHQSIEAALQDRDVSTNPPTAHLAEPRGAFTTLYLHRQLRGCVGYVFPVASLYRTVAETARAAAFEDTRFYPVTEREAPELEVHLSVLSLIQPIRPEEVEIGRHGLLISMGGARGLLLPQVPVEHAWDRLTFLEQTCRKAGLSLDAWQKGARLEAFTAEVFGDRDISP
ncbi:MAG TPA: AmmeMemoRadiSam system protein A [Terriglobales bacterium]|jgi:AmmeMemoRadiSam system protein A|nr:AmmeMemoRadiSam system protein A [Terriglobales bacterium]